MKIIIVNCPISKGSLKRKAKSIKKETKKGRKRVSWTIPFLRKMVVKLLYVCHAYVHFGCLKAFLNYLQNRKLKFTNAIFRKVVEKSSL